MGLPCLIAFVDFLARQFSAPGLADHADKPLSLPLNIPRIDQTQNLSRPCHPESEAQKHHSVRRRQDSRLLLIRLQADLAEFPRDFL